MAGPDSLISGLAVCITKTAMRRQPRLLIVVFLAVTIIAVSSFPRQVSRLPESEPPRNSRVTKSKDHSNNRGSFGSSQGSPTTLLKDNKEKKAKYDHTLYSGANDATKCPPSTVLKYKRSEGSSLDVSVDVSNLDATFHGSLGWLSQEKRGQIPP